MSGFTNDPADERDLKENAMSEENFKVGEEVILSFRDDYVGTGGPITQRKTTISGIGGKDEYFVPDPVQSWLHQKVLASNLRRPTPKPPTPKEAIEALVASVNRSNFTTPMVMKLNRAIAVLEEALKPSLLADAAKQLSEAALYAINQSPMFRGREGLESALIKMEAAIKFPPPNPPINSPEPSPLPPATARELEGTDACPICGGRGPHGHDSRTIELETNCRPAFLRWFYNACERDEYQYYFRVDAWGTASAVQRGGPFDDYLNVRVRCYWKMWQSAWFHEFPAKPDEEYFHPYIHANALKSPPAAKVDISNIAQKHVAKCADVTNEHLESMCAAWYKKTNLGPDEAEICQRTSGTETTWTIRKKHPFDIDVTLGEADALKKSVDEYLNDTFRSMALEMAMRESSQYYGEARKATPPIAEEESSILEKQHRILQNDYRDLKKHYAEREMLVTSSLQAADELAKAVENNIFRSSHSADTDRTLSAFNAARGKKQ